MKRITFEIKLGPADLVSTHMFQIWEQTDKPFLLNHPAIDESVEL